jgi:aryl-alcohol dehydrogenase-like predicted oxidoreductase
MGTMTFGSQADPAEAQRIVDLCFDKEVNFFDTANVYNQGLSEQILGKALGARRKNIILASKVRGQMKTPGEYGGLSRGAIRKAIADSLTRLGTDYLDIYYLHMPDYETPVEETLETMDQLCQEGKIRYIGVSNYSAWQMCEMHGICEKNGWQKPWIAQPMYNLVARGIEQEYVPFTRHFGISNVCYNPLAGGLLTGKQSKEQGPLANTRFDKNEMYLKRYWNDQHFQSVKELERIAQTAGITLVQLAIRWLLQQEGSHCVILGASRAEQLAENLQTIETPALEPSVLEACDLVWKKLRGPAPVYNR